MPSGVYKRITNPIGNLKNTLQKGDKRPPFSAEWRKHIGEQSKGRHPVKEFQKGHTPWSKGKKRPEFSGLNHPRWKGGITPINTAIRNSPEGKLWTVSVLKRDKFTCIWCLRKEEVSGKLVADHIQRFADYPELRFAIDNGRTLCKDCHKIRHSKYINY